MQGAVQPSVGGQNLSTSNQPTYIRATVVPQINGQPISPSEAASICGVTAFNWQQTITNLPSPSPFYSASDPCVMAHPLTYVLACPSLSAPPSQPDPPAGGYTSLRSNAYPFYDTTPNSDFFDSAEDGCLSGSNPLFNLICLGQDSPGGYLGFTTTLVGENFDSHGNPILVPLPVLPNEVNFTWTDTFNGTSGGVCCYLDNFNFVDPGSGSGGITITSLDGVPVPEPTSLALISAELLGLSFFVRRKKSASCKTCNFMRLSVPTSCFP
jgi:hypothetical protein